MEEEDETMCGEYCPPKPCRPTDPAVDRVLDQQVMRHNGRESFTNLNAMDIQNNTQMKLTADSTNTLDRTNNSDMASSIAAFQALQGGGTATGKA